MEFYPPPPGSNTRSKPMVRRQLQLSSSNSASATYESTSSTQISSNNSNNNSPKSGRTEGNNNNPLLILNHNNLNNNTTHSSGNESQTISNVPCLQLNINGSNDKTTHSDSQPSQFGHANPSLSSPISPLPCIPDTSRKCAKSKLTIARCGFCKHCHKSIMLSHGSMYRCTFHADHRSDYVPRGIKRALDASLHQQPPNPPPAHRPGTQLPLDTTVTANTSIDMPFPTPTTSAPSRSPSEMVASQANPQFAYSKNTAFQSSTHDTTLHFNTCTTTFSFTRPDNESHHTLSRAQSETHRPGDPLQPPPEPPPNGGSRLQNES